MCRCKKYRIFKKLILAAMLFSVLFSNVLAADSCKDYSGSAKNICNAVANAKSNFKDKNFMSSNGGNNASKKPTKSCNELSGIEKENCLNKNTFIEQNVLTESEQTNTVSSPEIMQPSQPTRQSLQSQDNAGYEPRTETANTTPPPPPPTTSRTNNKVNIFNN